MRGGVSQPLVPCDACTYQTDRGGCSHPRQDWDRDSEPDADGFPWCHSHRQAGSPEASASTGEGEIPAQQAGTPMASPESVRVDYGAPAPSAGPGPSLPDHVEATVRA